MNRLFLLAGVSLLLPTACNLFEAVPPEEGVFSVGEDLGLGPADAGDVGEPPEDATGDMVGKRDASQNCDATSCRPNQVCVESETFSECVCDSGYVLKDGACIPDVAGFEALASECDQLAAPIPIPGRVPDAGVGKGLEVADRPARTDVVMLSAIENGPMALDQDNTRYVLTEDITVPGGAFEISGNFVTLDLNGHTLTYGNEDATDGSEVFAVIARTYQLTHIAIINGRIEKGVGMCDGSPGGSCAALRFSNYMRETVEVAGLEMVIRGKATSAIVSSNSPLHAHHLLIHDETVDDGDRSYSMIRAGGRPSRIHDNWLVGVAKGGIDVGESEVYANLIEIEGTTGAGSTGINIRAASNYLVSDNEIVGRGVRPTGIATDYQVGSGSIFSNYVHVENTAGSGNNGATCLALTRPADVDVYCNWLELSAGGNFGFVGTNGSWGARSWGKCVRVTGGTDLHKNYIRAFDQSGESYAMALATIPFQTANDATIRENLVVSSNTHLFLETEAPPQDYLRVEANNFIRQGDYQRYRFLRNEGRYAAWAQIVDNEYGDGVDPADVELDFCGDGPVDIGIGAGASVEYWFTDDPVRASSGGQPIDMCGYRVDVQ